MNILLISQCHKNALKETRRVLDQFAERCGERTWQTAITKAGLETLRKLVRQTARKNTAVACYWTHGKNLTELLWIVGDKSQFNEQGRVPTNRTARNILKADDENGWQYATSIQILAALGALLHDLGKATVGFHRKLTSTQSYQADPYRHEWISLVLFKQMLSGCMTNEQCLQRLADFQSYLATNSNWYQAIVKNDHCDLSDLPSIAQFIGWLIVTHHRMQFTYNYYKERAFKEGQTKSGYIYNYYLQDFYQYELVAIEGWVKNNVERHTTDKDFWCLSQDICQSRDWQKSLTRWANKALNHQPLMSLGNEIISQPMLFHLARLALMVGDHNYSSLAKNSSKRVSGDEDIHLIANTDRASQEPKQKLDEHLIGVAQFTARFARLLPVLAKELPALQKNRAFTQRTSIPRFQWQNSSFDLVKSIQPAAEQQGFFGVNMASTGCGKTLANARIMYALADRKKGARFTIALGLRVLTLQTGAALKEKLQLSDESLATLIGGQASRKLFELNLEQDKTDIADRYSESSEDLIDGIVPNSDSTIGYDEFGTVIQDSKARHLLYTPIVSCTVDHLMSATENKRGGKHIAPVLRLLTSDLVLDEPDDFSQSDLPALARLVHLAGMMGSKVLLSSATLTPDLITGLFDAYQAGRRIWQAQNNLPDTGVICAWFDEFKQRQTNCPDKQSYLMQHQRFVEQRVKQLANAPVRRKALVLPIKLAAPAEGQDLDYRSLAQQLLQQANLFHQQHRESVPDSDKQMSLGAIRIANTRHLIPIVQAMYQQHDLAEDTQYHICCYHARQLLILRNSLENRLDCLLNRTQPESLFTQPEIVAALKQSKAKQHVFIVLGTPVLEVGRDHDFNWAIVEPSSMRSIIQLAGRINRHRPDIVAETANIAIMQFNIKALINRHSAEKGICYTHPGFEEDNKVFKLATYDCNELISPEELAVISSIPRIHKRPELTPNHSLADLEHAVMANMFNPDKCANYVTAYWQPGLAHHANVQLQIASPFRFQNRKQVDYICHLKGDNSNGGFSFITAESAWQNINFIDSRDLTDNILISYQPQVFDDNPQVKPWLCLDLETELSELAEKLHRDGLVKTELEYATVSLDDLNGGKWYFHPWLGFWH